MHVTLPAAKHMAVFLVNSNLLLAVPVLMMGLPSQRELAQHWQRQYL